MAELPSNFAQRKRATEVVNQLALDNGFNPISALTIAGMEGQGLKNWVKRLMAAFLERPLPHGYGTSNPTAAPKNGPTKMLIQDSIKQYASLATCLLRDKFPNHPHFPTNKEDKIPWLSTDMTAMLREWDMKYQKVWKNNPDYAFNEKDTKPLPQHHRPFDTIEERIERSHWLRQELKDKKGCPINAEELIDLQYIGNETLRRSALDKPHHLHNHFKYTHIRHACGRPGEASGQVHTNWHRDVLKQVVGVPWNSFKTFSGRKLTMVASKEELAGCWVLAFAMFAGPGGGLHRSAAQLAAGNGELVFPEWNSEKPEGIAAQITKALRSVIPKWVPDHVRESISAKSLRQGAIEDMALSNNVSVHESAHRSGHHIGNNSQSYLQGENMWRSLPAAHCLAGNKDCVNETVSYPDPSVLGIHVKPYLDLLFEEAFLLDNEVKAFKKGMPLHYWLYQAMVFFLMRFNDLEEKFGEQFYPTQWLVQQAERFSFADSKHPDLITARSVLHWWSLKLSEQFESLNDFQFAPTQRNFMRMLKRQADQSTDMSKEMQRFRTRLGDFEQEQRAMIKEEVSGVLQQFLKANAALSEENDQLKRRCAALESSASPGKRRRTTSSTVAGGTYDDAVDICSPEKKVKSEPQTTIVNCQSSAHVNVSTNSANVMTNTNSLSLSVQSQSHVPRSKQSMPPRLKYNQKTQSQSTDKGTEPLHVWFMYCQENPNFFDVSTPYAVNARRFIPNSCIGVKYVMDHIPQLVDYVATQDDRKMLGAPFNANGNWADRYETLVTAMMDKMWEFEGKDPAFERKHQKQTPGRGCTATVAALADRLKKYKKEVILGISDKSHPLWLSRPDLAKVELCERNEIPEPGKPPKGCQKIAKFFPPSS